MKPKRERRPAGRPPLYGGSLVNIAVLAPKPWIDILDIDSARKGESRGELVRRLIYAYLHGDTMPTRPE